jgi:hypothetical protein
MSAARGVVGFVAVAALVASTIGLAIIAIATVIVTTPTAALAQEFTVDSAASAALTSYLKQNRLPLVGAQIGTASTGARRLVLYGYVATQFGKSDAENKAIAYMGAPRPDVVNRIVIQPEIAKMRSGGHAGSASAASGNSQSGDVGAYAGAGGAPSGAFPGESIDQVLGDIERYGVKSPPLDPAMP